MPIKKAKKSSKGLRKATKLEAKKPLSKGNAPTTYLTYELKNVAVSSVPVSGGSNSN
jgi:type VI protein secretion system component Hcp